MTINSAFVNAVLADASYVNGLTPGMADDNLALALRARMTPELAEYISATFSVVTQIDSDELFGSGFDATVWRHDDGKIFVSMRGTEDLADFVTNGDLATNGAARAQIAEMVNWWLRLTTAPGPVQQIEVAPPVIDANGQWQYFRFKESVFGAGQLVGATGIELNGHSLGGHLATAFARIFGGSTSISHITTFNSAGFTASSEAIFRNLQSMFGTGTAVFPDAELQTNYFAKNGLNVATNSFYFDQIGQRVELFNEAGTGITNHYMYKLTDTLALMDLMSTIDPNLSTADATKILEAGSPYATASLESILDALRRFYGVPQNLVATKVGGADLSALSRQDFHQNLSALRLIVGSQPAATISSLAGMSASELITRAQAANGLAYRYALKQLHPFAILGPDSLYNGTGAIRPHNANGELDLYVSQTATPAGMTTEYLTDRAQMLTFLIAGNTNDTDAFASNQVSDQVLYRDLVRRSAPGSTDGKPTELVVFLGGTPNFRGPNTRVVGFGTDASDALQGRDNVDRLYGGTGADFLTGGKANDYLEGGAGMDVYGYGAQASLLSATTNDGDDTIRDTDGKGVIRYSFMGSGSSGSTSTVIGGAAIKRTPTQWRSPDGKFIYDQQGADLLVRVNGDAGGSIMVRDFDFAKAQSGRYLGIRLVEPASTPATANELSGDRTLIDADGTQSGVQRAYDLWGNELTADPAAGRVDTLYGRDDQGERIQGLGDNDVIFGDTAPLSQAGLRPDAVSSSAVGAADWIEGGAGRDRIEAGAGNDLIEAGSDGIWHGDTGGDIVDGGEGNDSIYGDVRTSLEEAIAQGDLNNASGQKGDFFYGGTGDDWLIGARGNDVLNGGAGRDLIVGGAGDDTVDGDIPEAVATLGWTLTRSDVVQDGLVIDFRTNTTGQLDRWGQTFDVDAGEADAVYGGSGNDWVYARGGDDYVDGGEGNDNVAGGAGSDILLGGAGNDLLMGDKSNLTTSTDGEDYLDGGTGNDTLWGNGGSDVLIGADGEDRLLGGDGNDLLYGGTGNDILEGGAGKDTYVYYRGDGVDVIRDPDIATASQYRSALALGPGITKGDVKFRLGSLMVDLGQGDSIHFEGFSADDPFGSPVLDSIQFADGTVMTYEAILDQGFDLDGTEENDLIYGTAVTDRIDAKAGDDLVIAKAGDDSILGGTGDDVIDAGAGNDVIDGGDGADIIEAGEGNDTVTTGAGADIVFGGFGDDVVFAGDGDTLIDSEGTNSVDLTFYAGLNVSNLEATQYQSDDGETYLNIHVRDDLDPGTTPATDGLSIQQGELGDFATFTVNDGQGGTLTLTVDELLSGYGAHGFVYRGRNRDESLTGTEFADTLFGGGGEDAIEGNAGDDRIDGGAGNDMLSGGAGNDTYLLAFNTGRDRVIEDADAEPNAAHTVLLDAGITRAMVAGRRMGEDLELRLRATDDALIMKDFYLQPQAWQDAWQVKDAANNSFTVDSFLTIVPPAAATWIDEEKAAYRLRREQVFAANRQQEGYAALGGNSFQRIDNHFAYSTGSSNSSVTTRQLVTDELNNDLASQELSGTFSSTAQDATTTAYNMQRPNASTAEGTRSAVSTGVGGTSAQGSDGGEFFPIGSAASVRINAGDVLRPVYRPATGNGTVVSHGAASASSDFEDTSKWTLVGYMVYRGGTGVTSQPGQIGATSTNYVYDQKVTLQDLLAGDGDNTVGAASSVVDAGAGNDTVTLGAGYFFAGPDWEGALRLDGVADLSSRSAAQQRYLARHSGLSGNPILYPDRVNLLGGFAYGGGGDDTITGSVGQDVIAGGAGTDVLDGKDGSDRFLVGAAESGIDSIADSGTDSIAYLDHYYWSRGILNWDERAQHANEWRLSEDGAERFYFKTEAEADAAALDLGLFDKTLIAPLPEAAPVLTRDDALYGRLVSSGVLTRDVLEFGPGLTLADLDITVSVDSFSAIDHPDRAWINGGSVSIRWGADSGVDFAVAALNGRHEDQDLLSGGAVHLDDVGSSDPARSWDGYRLGEGIEAFRFADGTTLDIDDLLVGATVVPVSGNYLFRADSGYQLIDRRYGAVEFQDGILASDVAIKRDGLDLVLAGPGAQGRIRSWYADPSDMPTTRLVFELDPEIDAATLTAVGLQVDGGEGPDVLTGVDGFANELFGNVGDDTLIGAGDADVLNGGVGEDTLDGGLGKDTYFFNAGDGIDTIAELSAGQGDPDASVIVFGQDVLSGLVEFSLGSLVIDYAPDSAIHFTGFNADDPGSTPMFERLEFQDGTAILYEDLLAYGFRLEGTVEADVISGSGIHDFIEGKEGNDTLFGRGGQDDMYGGQGDDTLAGGQGDGDNLEGGDGADTYVYAAGDGYDHLSDWGETPGEIDRLQLVGIAPTDVRVGRDDYSYLLVFGGADRLIVEGVPDDSATASIERIEFDDGTVWTSADLFARVELLPGTELNDALWGTAGDDVIEGLGGEDALLGNGGNDLLIGGDGGDFYYITAGGGADVVDNNDADGGWDSIYFADASLTDATLAKSGDDLVIRIGDGSDRVTLTDWYIDANRRIDQVNFGVNGGSWDAATLEQLAPTDGNSAPNIANLIADQAANEDATFSFTVPADAFSDPDAGDTLTYTTGALAAWLSFDADTRTFSGTPMQGDVGSIEVRVAAQDPEGLSAAADFTLTVNGTNDAPILSRGIDDQGAAEDLPFTFAAADETFSDEDPEDVLEWFASRPDGSSLPAWLAFDAATRTFSGTPGNDDAGGLEVQVTATDVAGLEASDTFTIEVANENDVPTVAHPMGERSFEAESPFSFAVSAETFADEDAGDSLGLAAALYGGSALPSWLSFNSASGTFGGSPTSREVGILRVAVTATDTAGASVSTDFGLVVRAAAGSSVTGGRADDVVYGGAGNETLTAKGGNDALFGGLGDDLLKGGAGNDALQGGEGADVLRGGTDQNLLDGGSGDDLIYGGRGSGLIVGGTGNDTIRTGSGNDVLLFNRGDGADSVYADRSGDNTLAFGGGIGYSDLSLSRTGKDLVVTAGGNDRVVLKDWYGGKRSVANLQFVLDGDYDASSSDPLRNRQVQSFDFLGMVRAFDSARKASPGLTSWDVTNALLQFHLSGSDDAAMGGDLAYWYGKNGGLGGISLSAAQQVIGASGFGSDAQSLRPFGGLQEGFVKLT